MSPANSKISFSVTYFCIQELAHGGGGQEGVLERDNGIVATTTIHQNGIQNLPTTCPEQSRAEAIKRRAEAMVESPELATYAQRTLIRLTS